MKRISLITILVCLAIQTHKVAPNPGSHYQVKPAFVDTSDLPIRLKMQFICFYQIYYASQGINSPLYFHFSGEEQGQG